MQKDKGEAGMTLLEVVVALSIFIIGITFVAQSDLLSFRFRTQREMRQQMLFYAAGQLEYYLEYGEKMAPSDDGVSPNYEVNVSDPPPIVRPHLELITVTVKANSANAPEPVELSSYRVVP